MWFPSWSVKVRDHSRQQSRRRGRWRPRAPTWMAHVRAGPDGAGGRGREPALGRRAAFYARGARAATAAAPGLAPLQREVLGAATRRRLCDEARVARGRLRATAAAPAAVDTALAARGPAALQRARRRAPPRARPARRRGGRRGDAPPDARRGAPRSCAAGPRASSPRRGGGAPRARDGRGLALVAARGGGAGAPARGEGHGDDALRDVAADALRLVLSVGPVRAAAPWPRRTGTVRRRRGPRVRQDRRPACCRPATPRARAGASSLSPRPRRLPAPRLAPAPGGLPRRRRAGRRPPAPCPPRRGATRAPR